MFHMQTMQRQSDPYLVALHHTTYTWNQLQFDSFQLIEVDRLGLFSPLSLIMVHILQRITIVYTYPWSLMCSVCVCLCVWVCSCVWNQINKCKCCPFVFVKNIWMAHQAHHTHTCIRQNTITPLGYRLGPKTLETHTHYHFNHEHNRPSMYIQIYNNKNKRRTEYIYRWCVFVVPDRW